MQKVSIKPTVPYNLLLENFAMDTCKAILMILCAIFSSESEKKFRKLEIFFNFSLKRFLWTGWKHFWHSYQRILLKISRSWIIFWIYRISSQSKKFVWWGILQQWQPCENLSIKVKNRTKFFFQKFSLIGNLQGSFENRAEEFAFNFWKVFAQVPQR